MSQYFASSDGNRTTAKKCHVPEKEVRVEPFDVYGLQVLFHGNEVERGVRLVQQRLGNKCVERDDLKAASASNTECSSQKVYRIGFGGDVEFLGIVSACF